MDVVSTAKALLQRKQANPDESPEEAAVAVAKEVARKWIRKRILDLVLTNLWWILPIVLLAYFLFFVVAAVVGDDSLTIPWKDVANYPGIESGVPLEFQTSLAKASLAYHVPEQFLAAEAFTESDWDPAAYADYDGSHAMGLTQFEPGTWSGSEDPDQTLREPDTDAVRIARYGGFGVDADGLLAPKGTSARLALHPKQLLALSESCGTEGTCVPYASPFDPADALMAGAKYLSFLRDVSGNWVGAAKGYYGGSGANAYAEKVVAVTLAYVQDFIRPAKENGTYRLFGTFPVVLVGGRVQEVLPTPPHGRRRLTAEERAYQRAVRQAAWKKSVPLFVPESGTVRWKEAHGVWDIRLPNGEQVWVPDADWMPWEVSHGARAAWMAAGTMVGFVDLATGAVRVS